MVLNTQILHFPKISQYFSTLFPNMEQGSKLCKKFAFPSEKLAKNLRVRTNLNFSDF